MNSETKTCQNCKQNFTIEPEDFKFYEKISVPPPTFCPHCRYIRRLLDRNEWTLYRRKCDFTGEDILSIYKPEAPFPVYKQDIWWSDKWDPMEHGQEIDFSRLFFEQFDELSKKVPHIAIANAKSINSEYTNQSEENKDCYILAACGKNEKCMYGNWLMGSYFVADSYMMEKSELCYECRNCTRCHTSAYLQDSADCISCYFSIDLRGCFNCFGCVGLRNKNYYFFNKQLNKEEYEKRTAEFLGTRDGIQMAQEQFGKLSFKYPRKFYHGTKNTGILSGDYLEETKDVIEGFNCRHIENIRYAQDAWWSKDSLDITEIYSELSYECQGSIATRSIGLRSCWDVFDSYYNNMCHGSSNLFGCVGLRQKHYCILNKQYSKEDYDKLKTKLIEHMKKTGEWGEYFPASISPFAYNECTAWDYYPLSKEEALANGYTWYDRPERDYKVTIQARDLPETIREVEDGILKEVIGCDSQTSDEKRKSHPICTTAFQIHPMELEFYRKMNLPLPQKCFPCRRQERFALRNPRQLWHRACMCEVKNHGHEEKCQNEFETSYAPDRPEIIYCEKCYNQEVA